VAGAMRHRRVSNGALLEPRQLTSPDVVFHDTRACLRAVEILLSANELKTAEEQFHHVHRMGTVLTAQIPG
jgi:hypothetical protein